MKRRLPRIAAWLVAALMLCTLLPTTALAAPVCTATINFRIIPVYLDDTKPLGYDVDYGSAVNDTFACTYSMSHSTNANRFQSKTGIQTRSDLPCVPATSGPDGPNTPWI